MDQLAAAGRQIFLGGDAGASAICADGYYLFHAYPVDTLKLPTSFKAYFFGELLHESRVKRL